MHALTLARTRASMAALRDETVEVLTGQSATDDGLQSVSSGGAWVTYPAAVCLPGQFRGVGEAEGRILTDDQRLVCLAHGTSVSVGQPVRWHNRVYRVIEILAGLSAKDLELRLLVERDNGGAP